MAGSAMVLPECRWMWQGIEGADSLVLNPHKWLGVAFDCSLYYVRDPQHLMRVMSTNPSYLQSSADAQVKNLRDWGIPLGTPFPSAENLVLRFGNKGLAGCRHGCEGILENAQWLAEQVRSDAGLGVLAPVPLQTLCIRHKPSGLCKVRNWTRTRRRGRIGSIGRGRRISRPRFSMGGGWCGFRSGRLLTEREHVEALWDLIQRGST